MESEIVHVHVCVCVCSLYGFVLIIRPCLCVCDVFSMSPVIHNDSQLCCFWNAFFFSLLFAFLLFVILQHTVNTQEHSCPICVCVCVCNGGTEYYPLTLTESNAEIET